MVDMVDMLYHMDMVKSLIMVDSIDMENMQKTFSFFKLLVDTSRWIRWTW